MIIDDQVRKCVAFLGIQRLDKKEKTLVGSCFFFGRDSVERKGKATSVHCVTARHVIDRARNLGLTEIFIRANHKDGDAHWLPTRLDEWVFHPTDPSIDVAVRPDYPLVAKLDHLVIPMSMGGTTAKLAEVDAALGDEVFITGLFHHHHGDRRNIPIVRVGNIACLVEEKIQTRDYGLIDGYLIEARSIGGLSGSPVFLNLGSMRSIRGSITMGRPGPAFLLLGLVHGHFDTNESDIDVLEMLGNAEDGKTKPDNVNMGIAVVVPYERISDVFTFSEKN